jgi:enterobacterial common antigen flippase
MVEIKKLYSETGRYRSILKSTSMIGGASVLNILIGMVRTKFVAVLLGPTGIGLLSMYSQIVALLSTGTGLGIASSGVRQVAEAVGSNNKENIARTIVTLRRVTWLTGALGMLITVLLCVPISFITFKNSDHARPIALLGVALLLAAVTSAQSSILQGTRKIADIAKITVISALCGTLISIPCFLFWGQRGIVVSLILTALSALVTSWWYARRVLIDPIVMSWHESRQEARLLLTLGFSFMVTALIKNAAAYLIQAFLLRQFGIEMMGIYNAAFVLSGVLASFVLDAMGTDYYPRLASAAGDNTSVHRMVNEQTQISIHLALPGLAAMIIFAPLIIRLFYAASFISAVPILRWCILGILGRVFSWPLGFILLAQGKGKLFFLTEFFALALHLAAVLCFTRIWALKGAGIAFALLYIVYTILMLFIMHRRVGRSWSRLTMKMAFLSTTAIVLLMLNCTFNSNLIFSWFASLLIFVVVSGVCLSQLLINSGNDMNAIICKCKNMFR